ncbi:MAG: hypothetical protein EBV05_14015, partial [Cyanobacteria bacterium WB6_1B_304]|nr:hypothetical protein [Cyanobacteria bacterium WB6_1B_304]
PTGYVADSTDCNDGNASIRPGAPEICDGLDNDCNGLVDEVLLTTWYRDADGDGYGTSSLTTQTCTPPAGYVADSTDCDDMRGTIHPGATEVCDSIDNDCDGLIDEGVLKTWYRDADGDGYGSLALKTLACSAPAGYLADSTDCDDTRASVNPTAAEVCDGLDNDCDGLVDDGVLSTWYRDADGDGFGTTSLTTQACTAPAGYVANNSDCDDTQSAVNPAAAEVCDSIDNDCDGLIDEGVLKIWYRDADGDGYGTSSLTTLACSAPAGYVANSSDCDDTKTTVNPTATEICDGLDNDCDGLIDDGVLSTWYRDADGDGYGTTSLKTQACTAPTGYVADSTDCNDANASIRPGATEVCDGVDNNCDGLVDEALLKTWYRDADGDGYGTVSLTTQACTAPAGYVANNSDCDDTRSAVNPAAAEVCDNIDNDCDGLIDEGVLKTWYRDADGDGYGTSSLTTQACSVPSGYVANNTDCDDTRA